MNEVFLEITPANFTVADFEKHYLPMPICSSNDVDFKMIFYTEADYYKYLSKLENESSNFLSQYCIVKSQELIEKNKFIIRVLTAMHLAEEKKYNCSNS